MHERRGSEGWRGRDAPREAPTRGGSRPWSWRRRRGTCGGKGGAQILPLGPPHDGGLPREEGARLMDCATGGERLTGALGGGAAMYLRVQDMARAPSLLARSPVAPARGPASTASHRERVSWGSIFCSGRRVRSVRRPREAQIDRISMADEGCVRIGPGRRSSGPQRSRNLHKAVAQK